MQSLRGCPPLHAAMQWARVHTHAHLKPPVLDTSLIQMWAMRKPEMAKKTSTPCPPFSTCGAGCGWGRQGHEQLAAS